MKNIIIGTAGHVDHGKTTLIKALTGIDTDRLKEEQERGMTIDLGFASLVLPNGQRVGIVDVPGHERFIKNMLAGAGGVDVALLIVAADESVMPQTVEHLEILQLLEVKRGVVALTKSDLVDSDWLGAVTEDISNTLSSTFLKDSPVIPVSSGTGQGIKDLLQVLQNACEAAESRDSSGLFRIPIDRIFTLTGFGTVITGTLVSGTVYVGDQVEIQPKGLNSRIRQLQVHGQKVDSATAGTRVAVNLAGLEVADLTRGDICAAPGTLKSSSAYDLKVNLLSNAPKPLKNRTRVRLYTGTAELMGRMLLLDREELKPGDSALAQFRSETPSAAMRGDRFVIRSYSPMLTIGGGVIIDPLAAKHRRFDSTVISNLETSSQGDPKEILEGAIRRSSTGINPGDLNKQTGLNDIDNLLEILKTDGKVIDLEGGRIIHISILNQHRGNILDALARFHSNNPLKPGMPKEELRNTAAKDFDIRTYSALISYFASSGDIYISDITVSQSGFQPSLDQKQQAMADKLTSELQNAGFNVPTQDELINRAGVSISDAKAMFELLVHRKVLVKVADGLYFHASAIEKAESMLREYLEKIGKITISEFRDLIQSSRKYALPILEYFDSKRVTRRQGDERILIK